MSTRVLSAPDFARFRRKISDNVLAVLQKRLTGLGHNVPVVLPNSTEIPIQGLSFPRISSLWLPVVGLVGEGLILL